MSGLPVIIMGMAGLFAITNMIRTQNRHLDDLAAENAVSTMRRLDDIFHNVARAADELASRKESLTQAVSSAKESALSDFFQAYVNNAGLKVMLASPGQKAVYRSWDPLNENHEITSDQQGVFEPKIIQIDGKLHFAVAHSILGRDGVAMGQAMVAVALDEKLLTALFNSESDRIAVGDRTGTLTFAGHDDADENEVHGRSSSSVIPSLWVEIHSNTGHLHSETVRAIWAMSLLFFCVSAGTGVFLWRSTERHIVGPIRKISGVIIDNRDVSELDDLPQNELGQLGAGLSSQKADLEQKSILLRTLTDEYQREASLLKVMSHDIATPLSVVRYSVDQLRAHQTAPEIRAKHAQRALSNVMTIEEILSHVRDMKALESGKRALVLKELTFGPIIKEIASTFKDRLESKGVTLEWMPSDEASILVADQISFRVSVASNLISNAIKFSDRGSRILVRCRQVDGLTRFEVRDYGGGIPVNIRENLFSTSFATNRRGSEGESGTGFGLPLVKFYVGLYGGTIDFDTRTKEESPTDHGTQFNIILKSKITGSSKSAA